MTDLSRIVDEATLDELPRVIGELEAARARAWARLRMPVFEHPPVETREDRVLTIPQAAEVLGCKLSYVKTLVRQHKLPTIPLPGTDKAGEARDGKFRRILLSSLLDQLKRSEQMALDSGFSAALKLSRDRRRAATNPQAPRPQPDRVR